MIEEFGLTKRFINATEVKVVVAVVADALIAAKKDGTALMSAWLWQAAPIGEDHKLCGTAITAACQLP